MLPLFCLGLFATYVLPAVSSKAIKYPARIDDDRYESTVDDESFLFEQSLTSTPSGDRQGKLT